MTNIGILTILIVFLLQWSKNMGYSFNLSNFDMSLP